MLLHIPAVCSCVNLGRLNYVSQNSLHCMLRSRLGPKTHSSVKFEGQKWSSRHLGFFFSRPFHSWHMLKLISWINWWEAAARTINCSTFPWIILQFLWFLGQGCSATCQEVTSPTGHPHHQGWRQWQVTGLSPSSWVLACLWFFHFDICRPLPRAYPMTFKLQN